MDTCWPVPGASTQRVVLTFIQEGGRLKDITFEPLEGAGNAVGRCLQQIAWEYPWAPGAVPDSLEVSPPVVRPSGWVYLAYVSLLSEPLFKPERGLLRPAPLVRACLEQGSGFREHLRYRVRAHPVRVSVFSELTALERPQARRTEEDQAVTDTERCIQAVLASTLYPGTKNFELEFSDLTYAPPPARPAEVSQYFPPRDVPVVTGRLDPGVIRDRLSSRAGAVKACWEAALGRRSGLFGGRTFRVRVDASGAVAFSHVVANRSDQEDEAVDYLLDRCLAEAVASVRFPPVEGGGAELAYSWVFERR